MSTTSSLGSGPLDSAPTAQGLSIGQYVIRRLQEHGLEDIFGIPGDYILTFYGMLEQSPINVVGCTREDCAGFAADAYARIRGLGCVCVTYCVGGMSVCNSIAGAFAEKSPVLLLTGSPGMSERVNNPLLHHKVRDFRTQIEVFEKLCIAGAELSDPFTAFREVDRVLDAAIRFKRPVYLDIPRDMVNVVPHAMHAAQATTLTSDALALSEAVGEAAEMLSKAKKPIIIAGIEVHRFGLQDALLALAEQCEIPMVATLLGKSVVRETHPLYLGLYEGAMGRDEITEYVEDSDCVLLLGAFMTDLNLGVYTADLDPSKCIYVTSEQLRIRHHHYHGVLFEDFLTSLAAADPQPAKRPLLVQADADPPPFEAKQGEAMTVERMITRLNELIDNETIVIADIGDSLFAATELKTKERTDFISPAYYTSMGFSVPAAVGAQTACPDQRVLVICGDGAFQMTGMELSTIVRNGYAPVVIVLDNNGYGTERVLHPGEWDYNEIHSWNYHELPKVLRGGKGYHVETEDQFDEAVTKAWNDRSEFSLLHVRIDPSDSSQTLDRMAIRLGQRVASGKP